MADKLPQVPAAFRQAFDNGHTAEFRQTFGTAPYQPPSILHPGAPLWHVRGEVEALAEMLGDGLMPCEMRTVAPALAHILREIDRRAAEWDGKPFNYRPCKTVNGSHGCEGWLDQLGNHCPPPPKNAADCVDCGRLYSGEGLFCLECETGGAA